MADALRVGIIGANPDRGWALTAHLPALAELPGFVVQAVATTRQESADATAQRFGVPHAYGSGFDLIADPDVDVVSVCVKVPHHYDYVKAALEARKHVFCEWPLAATTDQAVELADLAHRQGVRTVIGLQARRSRVINQAAELIWSGYVGEVLYASLTVAGAGMSGNQVPEERLWAIDRSNGVSTLSIMGGHNIDAFCYCVGVPREVQGVVAVRNAHATVQETGEAIVITSPDVVLATGRFGAGTYGSIAVQGGLPAGRGATLEVQGSDGVLVIESARSLHLSDDDLSLKGAKGTDSLREIPLDELQGSVFAPESIPGPARNVGGLYLALEDSIRTGSTPPATFDTAVDLHRILDALDESSSSGRKVILS